MEPSSISQDPGERELIRRAGEGDTAGLEGLLERYRPRLRRMIKLRLDRRLQGRVDPSDVIQEAYLEVSRKLAEYLGDPAMPFFLWLRLVTGQKLALVHRQHLGVQARDAGREVSLYCDAMPQASSAALAAQLLGKHTSPTQAVLRAERLLRLQEALNSLDPIDREILALRQLEELSRAETAQVLGISPSTADRHWTYARAWLFRQVSGDAER